MRRRPRGFRARTTVAAVAAAVAAIAAACQPTKPPPPQPTPRDVLVIGDSIGYSIGCALGDIGDFNGTPPYPCPSQAPDISVRNAFKGSCNVSPGWVLLYNQTAHNKTSDCTDNPGFFQLQVQAHQPRVVVYWVTGWEIIDRWSQLPAGCNAGSIFFCSPGADLRWGGSEQQWQAVANSYRAALVNTINTLRSGGAKVLVVNAPYFSPLHPLNPPPDVPLYYEKYELSGGVAYNKPNTFTEFTPSKLKVERYNQTLQQIVSSFLSSDVQLFDIWTPTAPEVTPGGPRAYSDYVCAADHLAPLSTCADPSQQRVIRHEDRSHFSQPGTQLIGELVIPRIRQMLGI